MHARIAERFQKLLKALFFCPTPNMKEATSFGVAFLVPEAPPTGKAPGGRVLVTVGAWLGGGRYKNLELYLMRKFNQFRRCQQPGSDLVYLWSQFSKPVYEWDLHANGSGFVSSQNTQTVTE